MARDGRILEGWGSLWATGEHEQLEWLGKATGRSAYKGWAGCCTWLNGAYWMRILERFGDWRVLVENLWDIGKKKVQSVEARVEGELVHPLLRGRDVSRRAAEPSAYILMVQDPQKRIGYSESRMRRDDPRAYDYLKRFEEQLRLRWGIGSISTRRRHLSTRCITWGHIRSRNGRWFGCGFRTMLSRH